MTAPARVAIEVDGLALEVLDLPGDAGRAALVLLHEGLGSVGLWRAFPSKLHRATGRRLVAYSRPGHGHSAAPAEPRTPAFFEDEARRVLPAVLERLGAADPILVGHSDGASIALIHAAEHPVAGLVLIAPHVFVEPSAVEAIADTREKFRYGNLRERMTKHHSDPDIVFWNWANVWLDPGFPAWNIESFVSRVSAPTLLIQGAEDPYGTTEQLDRIETRLPAQRLIFPGGHSPHLKHTDEIAAAIAGFVADLT